jgi:hypothetical protein
MVENWEEDVKKEMCFYSLSKAFRYWLHEWRFSLLSLTQFEDTWKRLVFRLLFLLKSFYFCVFVETAEKERNVLRRTKKNFFIRCLVCSVLDEEGHRCPSTNVQMSIVIIVTDDLLSYWSCTHSQLNSLL